MKKIHSNRYGGKVIGIDLVLLMISGLLRWFNTYLKCAWAPFHDGKSVSQNNRLWERRERQMIKACTWGKRQ